MLIKGNHSRSFLTVGFLPLAPDPALPGPPTGSAELIYF